MELPDELVGIEEELGIEDEPDPDLPGEATAERDGEDDEVERERFLSVAVGPTELAIHVNAVRRLVDVDHWTRVPRTSAAIEGVTDLRGEITAVIDPRQLFGVPQPEERPATQELVVFATGGDDGAAGIVVDEVLGVEAVPVTHVVLEPGDVDADREVVEELLESDLVAGLLRRRGAEASDAPTTSAGDAESSPAGTLGGDEASPGRDDGVDSIASAVDRGLGEDAIGSASDGSSVESSGGSSDGSPGHASAGAFDDVDDPAAERSDADDSAGDDVGDGGGDDVGDGAGDDVPDDGRDAAGLGGSADEREDESGAFGGAPGADAGASHEYVPVIDVDAVLERASEAAV